MAIAHRATTLATAAAQTITPTLPSGTAAGDRVFVYSVGTSAASTVPTGWTRLLTASLGTGTAGAGTGPRFCTVDYRDYDGQWTMPLFGQTTTGLFMCGATSYSKAVAGEEWGTPTSASGSDALVTSTTFSATAGSNLAVTAGNLAATLLGSPGNGSTAMTYTTPTATLTGATGSFTARTNVGSITGNDATIAWIDSVVSSGTQTAASVATAATTSGFSSGGAIFLRQAVVPAVFAEKTTPRNRARFRAATR